MRIPVFAAGTDPAAQQSLVRKSLSYCQAEVIAGRAFQLDPNDIKGGIQLLPSSHIPNKVDARGSREQSGCITARESALNAECDYSQSDVALLSRHYEHRLEQHILKGRKGTPRACDVIAARVKTILSVPVIRTTR